MRETLTIALLCGWAAVGCNDSAGRLVGIGLPDHVIFSAQRGPEDRDTRIGAAVSCPVGWGGYAQPNPQPFTGPR